MTRINPPANFYRINSNAGVHWSDEQEAIFEWFAEGEGNLVVRARAGTGKTTTILEGINRAPEHRILLAAFNKAIAEELSGRIRNASARAQTLHALGCGFCRRNLSDLQVDTRGERARALAKTACGETAKRRGNKVHSDVVVAVADLHTKIREILVDPRADLATRLDRLAFAENATQDMIEIERRTFVDDMELFSVGLGFEGFPQLNWSLADIIEMALDSVDLAKQPTSIIDFADMIFLPLVHNWVTPTCDLMVIDEAQDMSQAQLRLALLATKPATNGGRICIVGDNLQAIYGFRGADSGSLDRLKGELRATELGLKTTYRCPQAVVKTAQAFAPDFKAAPEAPVGSIVELKQYAEIVNLAQPGDFVLSRVNAPLVGACLLLIRAGKKAYVKGSDVGKSLLRLCDQLEFNCSTSRLTAFGKEVARWYEREVKKLGKDKPAQEKRRRLDDQKELLEAFVEGSTSIEDMHDKIRATFADTTKVDAIMCATVHRAKGLEAPRVFLLGKTFSRDDDEESNICYVATTRAKETLYIVGKSVRDFKRGEGTTPRSDALKDGSVEWCDSMLED